MMQRIARRLRNWLSGPDSQFVFLSADQPSFVAVSSLPLYIHVPFCRNCCPYCPYFKIRYDRRKLDSYTDCLLKEIEMYGDRLGRVEAPSVYFGGGTPTLLGDRLGEVTAALRSRFNITGPIAIEVSPLDVDSKLIELLTSAGVGMVSLGAQSFQEHFLKLIGRGYGPSVVHSAVEQMTAGGFDLVNVDLIFALPGQSRKNFDIDLQHAISSGADQVTAYPLFTFPYTSVGRQMKIDKLRMPPLWARYRQYNHMHDLMRKADYKAASVWSFKRDGKETYSSATRTFYLGMGAGAASHFPGSYSFNAFSVDAYNERIDAGRLATAMNMPMSRVMENYYWFYWQLYTTTVPRAELWQRFGRRDSRFNMLMSSLRAGGLLGESNGDFRLTRWGAFWVHLLQNHILLHSVNKLWDHAISNAFPERLEI